MRSHAAPNEALARAITEKIGGASEFVGPNEDAEAAILRTLKQMRSRPRRPDTVQWPTQPDWTAPEPSAVFPGDTLHLFAGIIAQPAGTIVISVTAEAGQGRFAPLRR